MIRCSRCRYKKEQKTPVEVLRLFSGGVGRAGGEKELSGDVKRYAQNHSYAPGVCIDETVVCKCGGRGVVVIDQETELYVHACNKCHRDDRFV
jgi:hypothetical protein